MIKMNRIRLLLSLYVFVCFAGCSRPDSAHLEQLREGFLTPPIEARPRALWDWVDGNFQLEEITREMEEAVHLNKKNLSLIKGNVVADSGVGIFCGTAFPGTYINNVHYPFTVYSYYVDIQHF